MPFKLRVGKRTGRYDLSRDLSVITVVLLDQHVLQYTLSADCTGKDCMNYVAQRMELKQNIFFGLRYEYADRVYRWIELDKPLRKQLEKSARDIGKLHFGVMFHTPYVTTLTDPVARSAYFRQMRMDVLERSILVSPDKAILLASYSLQADYGDYDESQYTISKLCSDVLLLPKHTTQSNQILEDLVKQVSDGHKNLRGLPRSQAELLYIAEVQHCERYGVESFAGKDEDGIDVTVGYCMEGVFKAPHQCSPVIYKWEEIVSIMANRRNLIINCAELAHAQVQMEDIETAKYAAYLCGLHLQFFINFCKPIPRNSLPQIGANLTKRHTTYCEEASNLQQNNANVEEIQPHQPYLASVQNGYCLNGYTDSAPCYQFYNAAADPMALAIQRPLSHSTTSVDGYNSSPWYPETVLANANGGMMEKPQQSQSIVSPLNPSMSSLSSGPSAAPQPLRVFAPPPATNYNNLQSWSSQQILADSDNSLNCQAAFNGSVPQLHPCTNLRHQSVGTRPIQQHVRLMAPRRPVSLDEYRLNELALAAYQQQQQQQQQQQHPQIQQQEIQQWPLPPPPPQHFYPNEELELVNAPSAMMSTHGLVGAPYQAAPITVLHPGLQYLASLQEFMSQRADLENPQMPVRTELNPSKPMSDRRPGSALSSPFGGVGEVSHSAIDRQFVSTPDLSSINARKLEQHVYEKINDNRPQNGRFPDKKVAIDAKTFENLVAENLDSVAAESRRRSLASIHSGCLPGEEQDEVEGKTSTGSPQRIMINRSSSGGSIDHLENCIEESQSAVASTSSSSSTPPDDPTTQETAHQAFHRFNPKLYEQQLLMFQQEQRMRYQKQLDHENFADVTEQETDSSQTTNGVHRSVAVLNLQRQQPEVRDHQNDRYEQTSTAHHHCLLVNDNGALSSDETLKTPKDCSSTLPRPSQARSTATIAVANQDLRSGTDNVRKATEIEQVKQRNAETFRVHHDDDSYDENYQTADRKAHSRPSNVPGDSKERSALLDDEAVQMRLRQDEGLKLEFERIPRKRVSAGLSTAQRRECQSLNRDPQVLPYEYTRVMLKSSRHNPYGYINASNVQITLGSIAFKYIATQGPLRESVVDFWQMVWNSGSRIIVMLAKCSEHGREQSFPYWPCSLSEHEKLKFGEYQLTLQSSSEAETHVTSTLILKNTTLGQKRQIYHLQYLAWPEGGVPEDMDSFLGFLDEVRSVKRHVANEIDKNGLNGWSNGSGSRLTLVDSNHGSQSSSGSSSSGRKRSTSSMILQPFNVKTNTIEFSGNGHQHQLSGNLSDAAGAVSMAQMSPMIVHCNSGAGRTGAYLLAEIMIHALQHNHDMEVARALGLLRQQRMLLVQTFAQYRFVCACLSHYLRKSRLI